MVDDRIDKESTEELTEKERQKLLGDAASERKNAKERLYDKVPLSYRQVDILTKILISIFVIMIFYFIVTSKVWR
ncbi:hypothetical protein [Robinsoniella peoriensis]|uniref:hypothetical protein n=1 Tax=Robinsoniella peoriensis TaxID=180332 RepID=UPI0005C7CECD|nr:hypothetical protein [Robinsoniella peoriensis]